MTNKRITLSAGDYIKLSDIPNEQVFKLVKQCFINAGFNDCNGKYAQWCNRDNYTCITIGANDDLNEFSQAEERQLSLSDVFNSVNGRFDWRGCEYLHITPDHLIYNQTYSIDLGIRHYIVKRIQTSSEAPEAIIQPEAPQWWDYDKGFAVGLPEKGTVVLYEGKEYEVIRSAVNDTNDNVVLLCLNTNRPNTKSDLFWEIVDSIEPLDYKTPKQIAVDKAFACLSEFRSAEQVLGELYDKGMLQVI